MTNSFVFISWWNPSSSHISQQKIQWEKKGSNGNQLGYQHTKFWARRLLESLGSGNPRKTIRKLQAIDAKKTMSLSTESLTIERVLMCKINKLEIRELQRFLGFRKFEKNHSNKHSQSARESLHFALGVILKRRTLVDGIQGNESSN